MSKRTKELRARSSPIYGNAEVQGPDGKLMFRCLPKRIKWYLDRDLADVVENNSAGEPSTIRLRFQPRGQGNWGDPFLLSVKENRCVACGATEDLTRHHVVPRCYKKNIPVELKTHDSHDVVALCVTCHWTYETEAEKVKKDLAVKYDAPFNGLAAMGALAVKAGKAANTLRKHSNELPPHVKEMLTNLVLEFIDKDELEEGDLENLKIQKRIFQNDFTHGSIVMSKLQTAPEVESFFKMWREHFVKTTNPQYLPDFWDINRPLKLKKHEIGNR